MTASILRALRKLVKRELPIRVRQPLSAFHPLVQRNASRCRHDVVSIVHSIAGYKPPFPELRWIFFLRGCGAWILSRAICGGKCFLAQKLPLKPAAAQETIRY